MLSDDALLARAKSGIEARLGWGNSKEWTNQDFIALGSKIRQDTGASVSHVTLKRLWGKVKYSGLPQIYTLNTLVQFLGYEGWRDFKMKNAGEDSSPEETAAPTSHLPSPAVERPSPTLTSSSKARTRLFIALCITAVLISIAVVCILFIPAKRRN